MALLSPNWPQLFGRAQPSTHEGEWRRLLGLGPPAADGAEEVEAGWATLPPPLAVDARVRRLLGRGVPAPLRGRVWFALLRAALEGRPDHGGLRAALEDGG